MFVKYKQKELLPEMKSNKNRKHVIHSFIHRWQFSKAKAKQQQKKKSKEEKKKKRGKDRNAELNVRDIGHCVFLRLTGLPKCIHNAHPHAIQAIVCSVAQEKRLSFHFLETEQCVLYWRKRHCHLSDQDMLYWSHIYTYIYYIRPV